MRSRQSTTGRGFTLIEVCLVVGLIGIMSALALPSITRLLDTRKSDVEERELLRELQLARDTARQRRRCMHVTSPVPSQLTLDVLTLDGAGACTATIESTRTLDFDARFVQINGATDITFDRRGSLDGTAADFVDVNVTLTRGGISTPVVYRVFRLLGLVRSRR